MSFSRPTQWYHSHADPIWPDGTFKSSAADKNQMEFGMFNAGRYRKNLVIHFN